MDISSFLFYTFATISLFFCLYVTLQTDPARSVLGLVSVFLSTALTWLLLKIDFIAVVLILVYVGAVMVLFLFVVMMVQGIKKYQHASLNIMHLGFLLLVLGAFLYEYGEYSTSSFVIKPFTVKELAIELYSNYPIPIQLASLILLVGMVAAVCLTYSGPRERLLQDREQQLMAHKKDRLRSVKNMRP